MNGVTRAHAAKTGPTCLRISLSASKVAGNLRRVVGRATPPRAVGPLGLFPWRLAVPAASN